MKRRNFLKSTGLLTGAALITPGVYGKLFARSSSMVNQNYDLVAIKGGEPDTMFDEAIKQFGGIKSFVKKNQKVVIKPNMGWDVIPELGANTNPKLVTRVIQHCFDAGAKEVYVFDHTCDDWRRCYANSGIEKSVKDAKGTIVPGHSESYYQSVVIKNGKKLTNEKVHELILECDVFINMPILKHHSSTRLTANMKNLMGVVWDRGYWHRNNLHQCIADFATFERKPDLNIIDAYYVMMKNGPRGVSKADITVMKSQLLSTNMVAADAAAAKLFGAEPESIQYIKLANDLGAGKMDLNSLQIKRIIL